MLLEKAYAKLHGNYYMLRGGYVNEALLDLTGCPSVSYEFGDEYVQHLVENGQFWDMLKYFDETGYLISVSTPGEERWVELETKESPSVFPLGHAFAVILVKEEGEHKLLNVRNPFGNFQWDGDWSR